MRRCGGGSTAAAAIRLGSGGCAVDTLNDNFERLGLVIIGIFAAAWMVSWLIDRARRDASGPLAGGEG